MRIGVYAGSLRPGGGLTALRQVLDALLDLEDVEVTVFTGAPDCSAAVQPLVREYEALTEVAFLPRAGSLRRYLASKLAFRRRGGDFDWLFSVNYHVPAPCRVAVYHLNLLSFQHGPRDGVVAAAKRLDARVACRRADLNLFESRYLLRAAQERTRGRIRNPELLYLGIHPAFFADPDEGSELRRERLLLVSSPGPHKDNPTALRALSLMAKRRPEVPWRLEVAGGQDREQWRGLLAEAAELSVNERVEILGPLPREELSRRMRSSLCLLNPSRIESFCMVALEAMASHCPAVVTSATSMPESVGDAALVVDPGDAEAFADAALRLHDDAGLRSDLVARGRARAEEFGPEIFRRRLREVLSS